MKPSVKKQLSAAQKAVHKQKEFKRLAVNKKEQDILGNLGWFRPLGELIIEITKVMKRK